MRRAIFLIIVLISYLLNLYLIKTYNARDGLILLVLALLYLPVVVMAFFMRWNIARRMRDMEKNFMQWQNKQEQYAESLEKKIERLRIELDRQRRKKIS